MDRSEMQELLIGTWTSIALIIDALVEVGAVERQDLIVRLSEAEALARDRRCVAISGLRRLIGRALDPGSGELLPILGFAAAVTQPVDEHMPPCRQGCARTNQRHLYPTS